MFDELFDEFGKFIMYMRANDTEEVRAKMLRTDKLRYWYCSGVKDREEVWSKIAESKWLAVYCAEVKDRPELWRKLTEARWCRWYCDHVVHRIAVWRVQEWGEKY